MSGQESTGSGSTNSRDEWLPAEVRTPSQACSMLFLSSSTSGAMCWVLSQEDDVGVGDFIPGTFSLPSLRQSLKDMLAGLLDEVIS